MNHLGTRALVLTQTEVDTTGKSYYGETNLYFLDSQGKHDCRVVLGIQIRCNLCRARKAAGSNVILQLAPLLAGHRQGGPDPRPLVEPQLARVCRRLRLYVARASSAPESKADANSYPPEWDGTGRSHAGQGQVV